jgi:hypothetical protein
MSFIAADSGFDNRFGWLRSAPQAEILYQERKMIVLPPIRPAVCPHSLVQQIRSLLFLLLLSCVFGSFVSSEGNVHYSGICTSSPPSQRESYVPEAHVHEFCGRLLVLGLYLMGGPEIDHETSLLWYCQLVLDHVGELATPEGPNGA